MLVTYKRKHFIQPFLWTLVQLHHAKSGTGKMCGALSTCLFCLMVNPTSTVTKVSISLAMRSRWSGWYVSRPIVLYTFLLIKLYSVFAWKLFLICIGVVAAVVFEPTPPNLSEDTGNGFRALDHWQHQSPNQKPGKGIVLIFCHTKIIWR